MDLSILSSILFSSSKNMEFIQQLNVALKQLIENDKSYVNDSGSSPKLWECKWLNSIATENGYPRGYTVWMNTNTYEQIANYYYKTIQSYITNNATLNLMYQSIDQSDKTALNKFFIDVAKGTANPNVSAIFCLGDMSQPVQIRVSKIDNNKELPTTSAWEDFFAYSSWNENYNIMMSSAASAMENCIQEHMQQYHLSSITLEYLKQEGYFSKTPFNVENVQTQDFFDHTYCTEMSGFDYVKQWKISQDGNAWCKVWNSGYVEQGGFISNLPGEALIPVQFMTTYNYPLGASFYQRDYQTYNTSYDIKTTINPNNRYIVTVTPILANNAKSKYPEKPSNIGGELVYSSIDVTNMTNSGFSIVNTDIANERYSKYSWHVCGYKVISDSSQIFDNSTTKIASNISSFTIQDNVVIGFVDDGYATIILPNGIISIGKNAFDSCYEVQSFVLPSTLQTIGQNAFSNCNSLRSIAIPENTTRISSEAFSPCQQLAYVGIGSNVKFIGDKAFCNDTKIATVTRLNGDNTSYAFDMVGDQAFYNTSMNKLDLSLKPASINAFWGDECFANNTSLKEVRFLSSNYMSTKMFNECTSLTSVSFRTNTSSYVYPNVFEHCSSLRTITLPSNISHISEEMFKKCSVLENIKFNSYEKDKSTISLIQKNAFNECYSLNSLELPASIDSIRCFDDACLSNCSLAKLTLHGINKNKLLKSDGNIIDSIAQTGLFRLNHDCTIECNDGTIQFTYNPVKTIPYVEPTNYLLSIDMTTTSNFEIAISTSSSGQKWWYHNAQQLYSQANNDNTPVLFICSLLGSGPCQEFIRSIFNNAGFQDWTKKQKFYLCMVDCDKQPYYDKQLAFCNEQLKPNALNVAKTFEGQTLQDVVPNAMNEKFSVYSADGDSSLNMPMLVFYHNTGEQILSYAYSYSNIFSYISKWGIDNVMQCIKSLCLYHFDNNDLTSPKYVVDAVKPFDIRDYS